jgi:hypothetical protein
MGLAIGEGRITSEVAELVCSYPLR